MASLLKESELVALEERVCRKLGIEKRGNPMLEQWENDPDFALLRDAYRTDKYPAVARKYAAMELVFEKLINPRLCPTIFYDNGNWLVQLPHEGIAFSPSLPEAVALMVDMWKS